MKLVTKADVVRNIPNHWRMQYKEDKGDKYDIWRKLKAEENLTEDKAAEIIGNRSWSSIKCDECQQESELAVVLGEEPDYKSSTAMICDKCINKAVLLTRKAS